MIFALILQTIMIAPEEHETIVSLLSTWSGRDGICFTVYRPRRAVKATAGVECSFSPRPQFAATWPASRTIHSAHRDASTSASSSSPARSNARHLPACTGCTASSRTCWSLPAANVRGKVFSHNACVMVQCCWTLPSIACYVLILYIIHKMW